MRRNALMLALAVVLLATAGIVLLLTYLQVRVRLYPDSPPLKPQPVDSPFERVFFSTEDGLTISAWYAAPRSGAGQAVMLMHGLQGNRDQLLPHAAYLRESGYGVLLIDFRNHGESEGSVTSMGYHEIKDARAAYTYLQARPGSHGNRDLGAFNGRCCGLQTDERSESRRSNCRCNFR